MLEFIRDMVDVIVKDAIMPTGKNLTLIIKYVCGLTVINLILRLFKLPMMFSISGCFLALTFLLVILHTERKEYVKVMKLYEEVERRGKDEISKLRRNVDLHKKAFESRQQNSGAGSKSGRTADVHEQPEEHVD